MVKIIVSLVDYFHQVSWGLEKKCGIFISGNFLNVSRFFPPDCTYQSTGENITPLKKNLKLIQTLVASKKSTIFVQSSWNLVKIITSWKDDIAWIWAQLDKNYAFFTYSQMFGLSNFLLLILYILDVLTHTTAWDRLWRGDLFLRLYVQGV